MIIDEVVRKIYEEDARAREIEMSKKQEQREYIQQFQKEQALWQQQEKVSQKSIYNYLHIFILSNVWQKKRNASNSIKSKKKPRQLVDKLNELKNLQQKNMFKVSHLFNNFFW